jgi:hypothetical protein
MEFTNMGFAQEAIETVGVAWSEVTPSNNALDRLRASRLSEVRPEGDAGKSKVVWKIAVFQQAILYRIVMLADGCADAWNAGNPLAATLCARAITETSALLLDFEARLRKQLCSAGDFPAIDALVMNRTFSTRLTDWQEQADGVQAQNILTTLKKIDEKLLPGVYHHYEYLSEICHPNSLGHNLMFGNLSYDTATVTLSDKTALDKGHFDHVFAAFFLIQLVERFLQKIGDLKPRVLELSEAAKRAPGAE